MSAVCRNTSTETLTPLLDSVVDDALVLALPLLSDALPQLIQSLDILSVDASWSTPHTRLSIGFRSGLLGGQSDGGIKSGVSRVSSCIACGAYDVIKRHLVQRIFKEIFISWMVDTGTSQILLPAKFHNFTIRGLFFIHKNKRVQFFMKHGVYLKILSCCQPPWITWANVFLLLLAPSCLIHWCRVYDNAVITIAIRLRYDYDVSRGPASNSIRAKNEHVSFLS